VQKASVLEKKRTQETYYRSNCTMLMRTKSGEFVMPLGFSVWNVKKYWDRAVDNFHNELIVKVKVPLTDPKAQSRGRSIAVLFLDLGTRKGWVVSIMPQPLYSWERPSTHSTGGWVGPRAGLDVCEKSRPHRDLNPGPSNP
jgi:hypothetical protein